MNVHYDPGKCFGNNFVDQIHLEENIASGMLDFGPFVHLELLSETFGNHQNAAPYAILGAFNVIESMKQINPIGDISHDENINVSDVLI